MTEGGSVYSAPVYSADSQNSELDQFEASLHMPVDRSQSDRGLLPSQRVSRAPIPRNHSENSSLGKTVTIQVPPGPFRTCNGDSNRIYSKNDDAYPGRQTGYSNSGEPVTARRIQPNGVTEQEEPGELDFRQRCHSDSRAGHGSLSSRTQYRPMSCYTTTLTGEGDQTKVTGLPPKGILPRSYSQRLERAHPSVETRAQHQGAPPCYPQTQPTPSYFKPVLAPFQAPDQQQQQETPAPIDSLRNAMMRRWDSEHSCLPAGDSCTESYPMAGPGTHRAPATGNNASVHLACWVSADAQAWELQTQTCI